MSTSPALPADWVTASESRQGTDKVHHWKRIGWLDPGTDYQPVNDGGHGRLRLPGYKFRPEALDECERRAAAQAPTFITYRGPGAAKSHQIWDRPPSDGTPFRRALERFGLTRETLWKLIDTGKVVAGLGADGEVSVSRSGIRRHLRSLCASESESPGAPLPPADGEPLAVLAREFGVSVTTIEDWCEWDPHPALGYRIRQGRAARLLTEKSGKQRRWRGILASRADVKQCVEARTKPLHRRFPGNDGVWIAEGVFSHDHKGLCYTDRYVTDNRAAFGLAPRSLSVGVYRARLESFPVVYPAPGSREPWTVTVHTKESLDRLVERRAGREHGAGWLSGQRGLVWAGSGGLYFSARHIAALKRLPLRDVQVALAELRLDSRTEVPLGNSRTERPGGRSVIVYHEAEANRLFGLTPTAAGNHSPGPGRRGRRRKPETARLRAFCYERRSEGRMFWEDIGLAVCGHFGRDPLTAADACIEARRHALYQSPPLPWPIKFSD